MPLLFGLVLSAACCRAAEPAAAATLRDEWTDADTGHRVLRLSRVPGSSESLYFHQNAFTAEGDKMVFVNSAEGAGNRLFVLDWANHQCPSLTIYLPGNGGLLYSAALMAAGWDRAPQRTAPGFPDNGQWTIRWAGLRPAP